MVVCVVQDLLAARAKGQTRLKPLLLDQVWPSMARDVWRRSRRHSYNMHVCRWWPLGQCGVPSATISSHLAHCSRSLALVCGTEAALCRHRKCAVAHQTCWQSALLVLPQPQRHAGRASHSNP
jgi:hypothetical protein